jgi:CMP-N-acetylneuraminic acid synthetase
LVEKKSLYGDKCLAFVMSPDNHVNIDTLDDWDKAERALTRRS